MNVLRSFLRGLWRGLDVLRRFLHLILLLALLGFIVGALHGSIPRIPDSAALVVAPEGQLVEQLSGDPLQRAISQARGQGRSENSRARSASFDRATRRSSLTAPSSCATSTTLRPRPTRSTSIRSASC